MNALEHNRGNDYTLRPEDPSVWITVGEFSVYVVRQPGGHVDVAIYPIEHEAEDAPDQACATSAAYQ